MVLPVRARADDDGKVNGNNNSYIDGPRESNVAASDLRSIFEQLEARRQELESVEELIENTKEDAKKLRAEVQAELVEARNRIAEQNDRLTEAEEALSKMKRVRFEWRGVAREVSVTGSFNGWDQMLALKPMPSNPNEPGNVKVFASEVRLYPGEYEYKFVVDGNWMHDDSKEVLYDDRGNANNILKVK